MLDNSIFDVVIGLLFVFFVCSLIVSGMNEAVRKALNTRSKVLWASLQRILSEPGQDTETDAPKTAHSGSTSPASADPRPTCPSP